MKLEEKISIIKEYVNNIEAEFDEANCRCTVTTSIDYDIVYIHVPSYRYNEDIRDKLCSIVKKHNLAILDSKSSMNLYVKKIFDIISELRNIGLKELSM